MKNPVAKYSRRINRSTTHRDRKSARKRGYRKHRRDVLSESSVRER